MNNNKISAQLQDDIMRVLRGETTQKIELPTAIMEAAKQASIDLNHAFLDEGYLSAERRREILRRNLNEGLKNCGCSPTSDMVARFEEEALKPAAKTEVAEVKEEAVPAKKVEKTVQPIKEAVKVKTESPITEELRNFVANLTEEDRNILRDLLNKKN